MSISITICPNLVQYTGVSWTISPVTQVAEQDVNKESIILAPIWSDVAAGKVSNNAPIKIALAKLSAVNCAGCFCKRAKNLLKNNNF